MNPPKTLQQAIQYFTNEENCRNFMIAMRWPDGKVRCPRCGSVRVAWLEKAKLYYCAEKHPKQKFSLKVGTVLEDSPIGLDKWFPAMWLLSNCKNGVSSYELSRDLGVTQKTAWFMLHRIRAAMKNKSMRKLGSTGGPVEVDEVYLGGRFKNMHLAKRQKLEEQYKNCPKTPKAILMGMLDRDTRQVRTKMLPFVRRGTLMAEILNNITHGSKVFTDGHPGYVGAEKRFVHDAVNHVTEYVRGEVHTNGIENFWSLLRRTLSGTYVAVEPFHLDAYADEQAFRFNNRATKDNPLDDADRFMLAVSQIAGKRLTYAELTGKVGETAF